MKPNFSGCARHRPLRHQSPLLSASPSLRVSASFPAPFRFPARVALFLVAMLLANTIRLFGAADPFAEFIRSTEARTPQDELKGFHVPPGFEVQLVASE